MRRSRRRKKDSSPGGQQSTRSDAATATHGKPFHKLAGTGPAFWGPGDLYTFLATGDETNDSYFQLEALVPPGGAPPHIHHNEDETFYLAQGSLEMHLRDKVVSAKAGDFVNVPQGTVHAFKNVGGETAKMMVTFVPAGFEKYFEEVFSPAGDRAAIPPPPTDELIERMTAAAPKHGCEIHMVLVAMRPCTHMRRPAHSLRLTEPVQRTLTSFAPLTAGRLGATEVRALDLRHVPRKRGCHESAGGRSSRSTRLLIGRCAS